MQETHRGIIALLRSAVTGQPCALPEAFDLEQMHALARAHHMGAMMHAGAVQCGISEQHPVMKQLFQTYCKALLISERQMDELQRVFEAFERNGIDYMPLKGCVLKALYPQPEMRTMGDADILIREEQQEPLARVMQALGFTCVEKVNHHDAWQSPCLTVELHRWLIPNQHAALHNYFGTGWQFAHLAEGHRYAMAAEDEFLFLLAHFVKHFSYAGIGCRHVVDLWVFLRQHPALNMDYVRKQTDQILLSSFLYNVLKLLCVWFEDAPSDELTDRMTEYIMANGSWGTMSNYLISMGVDEQHRHSRAMGVRAGVVRRWLYPGWAVLQAEYPVLAKAPVLLPVCACGRILRKLCTPSLVRQRLRGFAAMKDETIAQHRAMLSYFGLNE